MAYSRFGIVGVVVSLGCLAAGACGNPEVYQEEPRDFAADALAEAICEAATPCCVSIGYRAPSDDDPTRGCGVPVAGRSAPRR